MSKNSFFICTMALFFAFPICAIAEVSDLERAKQILLVQNDPFKVLGLDVEAIQASAKLAHPNDTKNEAQEAESKLLSLAKSSHRSLLKKYYPDFNPPEQKSFYDAVSQAVNGAYEKIKQHKFNAILQPTPASNANSTKNSDHSYYDIQSDPEFYAKLIFAALSPRNSSSSEESARNLEMLFRDTEQVSPFVIQEVWQISFAMLNIYMGSGQYIMPSDAPQIGHSLLGFAVRNKTLSIEQRRAIVISTLDFVLQVRRDKRWVKDWRRYANDAIKMIVQPSDAPDHVKSGYHGKFSCADLLRRATSLHPFWYALGALASVEFFF